MTLASLVCVDYDFMKSHCDKKEMLLHKRIANMLLALTVMTFFSINVALCHCFHTSFCFCWTSILLSSVLTFAFINMYRFIITTIGLDPKYSFEINVAMKKHRRITSLLRLFFVGLVGFVLGQGLLIFAFSGPIDQITAMLSNPDISDETVLKLMNGLNIHPSKIDLLASGGLISRVMIASGLLGQKIYLVEFMIVALYCIPVSICLFYKDYRYGQYEKLVWGNNRLSILNDHRHLEEIYSELFETTVGEKVELYTGYLDSPFDTVRVPVMSDRIL